MRLTRFFGALGAAAAFANIGLVAAAPQGHSHDHFHSHGRLSKRAKAYFCDSSAQSTLLGTFEEMKNMLTTTISRTSSLVTFLHDPPNHVSSYGQLLQSTFYTFESIFGKLEYGTGSDKNAESIARANTILSLAETIKSKLQIIESLPDLEIYCSDAWLIRGDPEGDIDMTNSYLYWDDRGTKTMPFAQDFAAVDGACRDQDATHYAWVNPYMSSSQTTDGQTTVLTMCQKYVDEWVASFQGGTDTMTSWAQQVWTHEQETELDFFQIRTMSTALMHEFTHAPAIVGSDYLLDQPCVLGGRSVKAYGWQCIVQLATYTPDLAIKNADSFSFYVTAMFLSLSDWSLGYPRAIPDETSGHTDDDGLAAMMSHLTV